MATATQVTPSYSVELPSDLYNDIRNFLMDSEEKDALTVSEFTVKAANWYLLLKSTQRLRESMADVSEDEISAMVDQALAEVRAGK
jgi:hypothetical protein